MVDVVIYTRDWCGYCAAAKNLLTKKGVAFDEKNASDDAAFRDEMLSKSNGGTTFPQIFIGDAHVGGCDDLFALERNGKLDAMLTGEG